jgi:hypothetical protein
VSIWHLYILRRALPWVLCFHSEIYDFNEIMIDALASAMSSGRRNPFALTVGDVPFLERQSEYGLQS